MYPPLVRLLNWCADNGIYIHPNVRVLHEKKSGICVRAANCSIDPEQSLVVIPKSAILSTRSCALAAHIPHSPCGHEATLALALALYSEQLLGSRSRWAGYLQSLPAEQNWDGIALFWGFTSRDTLSSHNASDGHRTELEGLDFDGDAVEAIQWLNGTEAQKHFVLSGELRAPIVSEILGFYSSVAAPILRTAGLSPSEREFRHAYALVSSRAFMIDAYHGLAMVPIADAFNHSQDNTVHLESDYDVCTFCGSLSECPHDTEHATENREDMAVLVARADAGDPDNTCEMVANAPVAPAAEIFNTYGASLGNAELLVRYGFMLDANDNDVLTWTTEEVWDAAGAALNDPHLCAWEGEIGHGVCMEILRDWQYDRGWTDSELVVDSKLEDNRNALYMTADGALSHKLWVGIALASLKRQGVRVDVMKTCQLLQSMARTQIQLEQGQATARGERGDDDNDAYEALSRQIRTIGELCTRRLDRICRVDILQQGIHGQGLGLHSAVVGKYIDGLGTAQQKTRLAVTLALGETSILESCVASWSELTAITQPRVREDN